LSQGALSMVQFFRFLGASQWQWRREWPNMI
jgi:hypothetical protein